MPGHPPLTVVVADGHARYREALAQALAAAPEFSLLAQADDGPGALEAAARLRPGLLVIDAGTHGLDGYEVCRRLAEAGGGTSVVLVAASPSDALAREAAAAGALGLLPKDLPRPELVGRIAGLVRGAPRTL